MVAIFQLPQLRTLFCLWCFAVFARVGTKRQKWTLGSVRSAVLAVNHKTIGFLSIGNIALDKQFNLNCDSKWFSVDRICGVAVRVPGCRTEMYCDACEVQTVFIHVM
jgi:hypothetical protein